MSMASVGGAYAALMNKGAAKAARSNAPTAPKTKSAKVISLKDTREKKPPPQGSKSQPTEAKKTDQPQYQPSQHAERDLTRREVKQERKPTDRHVPRSGVAEHPREHKNETVAEALEAANERPTDSYSEKRREYEERDAERRRKEEAELRKMTYADYQKSLAEKKNELSKLNKSQKERKVDAKRYAKMTEVKKADFTFMKLDKEGPTSPPSPAPKKGDKPADAGSAGSPKPAGKKTKFHKTSDIQLGFYSSSPPKPQQQRPPRTFDNKREAAEVPAAMEEFTGAAAEPPAQAEVEAVGDGDEW